MADASQIWHLACVQAINKVQMVPIDPRVYLYMVEKLSGCTVEVVPNLQFS